MKSNSIAAVQILRAYAALAVVFHHVLVEISAHLPGMSWLYNHKIGIRGQSGVDVFFVISGFIMLYTHQSDSGGIQSAKKFLFKRAKRIYPIYWVWTSVYIGLWATGRLMRSLDMSHGHVIASFLLVPFLSNGMWGPILGAGWTLSYEMYFYLVFTACLVWFSKHLMPAVVLVILLLFGISQFFPKNSITLLPSNSLVFEFVFGMAVAKVYKAMNAPKNFGVGIFLIVLGLALTFISDPDTALAHRFIYYGVPSALILLGACYANGEAWEKMKLGLFLGNGSYSIYLTHGLMIPVLGTLIKTGHVKSLNPDVLAITAFLCITAVCSITYPLVEKPLLKAMSRKKSSSDDLLQKQT